MRAKLVRPLDFLVVADHAEYFGLSTMLRSGDPALLADPIGQRWYDTFNGSKEGGYEVFLEIVRDMTGEDPKELIENPAVKRSVWERANVVAEKYNQPVRSWWTAWRTARSASGTSASRRCVR